MKHTHLLNSSVGGSQIGKVAALEYLVPIEYQRLQELIS